MGLHWDLIRTPSWELALDWRCWAVGLYWDDAMIGVDIGPLGFTWYPGDDRFKSFCRSWMLFEKRIGRTNIHLDLDTYIWRVGYIMAAPWDHGIYVGPANLQIEYDRWNNESA
jgi:hypothetical protein